MPRFSRFQAARISTHSALTGGDADIRLFWVNHGHFNPLRPHGRRPAAETINDNHFIFQPTPPSRAETAGKRLYPGADCQFQPTPPSRAETSSGPSNNKEDKISTHSALTGGDPPPTLARRGPAGFQPTPPSRAETGRPGRISTTPYFNPLRPHGRRPDPLRDVLPQVGISTHSALTGGDRSGWWTGCRKPA